MTSNYSAEQAVIVKIPVVLTIKDAMQKIKQDCPDTAISEFLSDPEAEKFQPKGSANNGIRPVPSGR